MPYLRINIKIGFVRKIPMLTDMFLMIKPKIWTPKGGQYISEKIRRLIRYPKNKIELVLKSNDKI